MTAVELDHVPFVDLAAQHLEVAAEVDAGLARVFATTAFVGGPDVQAFEAEMAAACRVDHCVGVANGTDAIELVVRALDLRGDDEVLMPANTFIATAEGVARAGARVTLADCDDEHLLLDPADVVARLTPRTRAVFAVDLYGQVAPLAALREALDGRGVLLLEDAAQSQGARHHGRAMGSGVVAAATSFYPGKNLGAYGDAGAVLTDDDQLADRIRAIANHGGTRRYEHRIVGCNSRLDSVQAVVLRAKLRRLDEWNAARRAAADRYEALLAELPAVRRPRALAGNEHVWHLYVVRVPERDRVLAHLQANGIGAGIHYPLPVHRTEAFAHLGYTAGEFPVAEAAAGELLSLPMHPHLTEAQQVRVVEALSEVLA